MSALSPNKHIPPITSTSLQDNLTFPLYSISLFKFDNPFPEGLYKRLENNKKGETLSCGCSGTAIIEQHLLTRLQEKGDK